MKNLFTNEGFRYTEDAYDIEDGVRDAIDTVFKKYTDLGYSPREISHVLMGLIWETELSTILGWKK